MNKIRTSDGYLFVSKIHNLDKNTHNRPLCRACAQSARNNDKNWQNATMCIKY